MTHDPLDDGMSDEEMRRSAGPSIPRPPVFAFILACVFAVGLVGGALFNTIAGLSMCASICSGAHDADRPIDRLPEAIDRPDGNLGGPGP